MRGFETGASDYVTKPFNPAELLARVHTHVELKKMRDAHEELIAQLQEAAGNIRTLSGLVPICMHCKQIRDDRGFWERIETYVEEHSEAEFTHGLCPDCAKKHYPELDLT